MNVITIDGINFERSIEYHQGYIANLVTYRKSGFEYRMLCESDIPGKLDEADMIFAYRRYLRKPTA